MSLRPQAINRVVQPPAGSPPAGRPTSRGADIVTPTRNTGQEEIDSPENLPSIYGGNNHLGSTGGSFAQTYGAYEAPPGGIPVEAGPGMGAMTLDDFDRCMDLVTSVFVEGDWSIARLRQRVQKAALELTQALDAKLLFVDEVLRNKHVNYDASLPGYVLKAGDPLTVINGEVYAKHPEDAQKRLLGLASRGVRYMNFMAFPVFYPSGKIIAVVQVNATRQEGGFTERDQVIMKKLCAFTGKAAANCRLMESLTEGQRKNRVLNKATVIISSELASDQIFRKVSSLGCELVDADKVSLFVQTEDKTSLWTKSQGHGKKSGQDKQVALDGMLGYTMRTNEALNVKDVAKDARFKAFVNRTGGDGIVDTICVPAKNCVGETVGVIQAANMRPGRTFTKGDVERLGLLGSYAMIALENSKALDKASHLSVVSVSIMEKLDLADTRSKIEEKTTELVNAQLANLFILDEEVNELSGYMLVGRSKNYEKVRIPVGKFPVGQVAQSGQSVILGDATKDLKVLSSLDERFGTSTRNLLIVPMLNHNGKVIAVMQACNKRAGAFTNLDESLLRIFMNSAGIALSNALKANELDRFLRALKDLVARTGSVGSSLDFETCLSKVQENGLEVIPARALLLHIVDPKTRALHTKHGGDKADTVSAAGTGIAGYVAETGAPLNVSKCEEDARFHPKVDSIRGLHAECCIAVPVMNPMQEKVIAVLQWVNKTGVRRFSNLDENLAQVFGNIVSVAMLNTQAREEAMVEKQGLDDLCSKQQELLEIAQSVTALPTVDDVANAVTKHATQLLEAARCTVFMVDRDSKELYMLGTDLRAKRFASSGIVGEVIKTGRPAVVHNVNAHPLFNSTVDQRSGCHARSMVCVPILGTSSKQATGAIQVLNKLSGNFRDADASMMVALASLAATSFERVESVQRVILRNEFLKIISSDLDVHTVINIMCQSACDVFKAESARVFIADLANSEVWTKKWSDHGDASVFRVPMNQGVVGHIAVKGGSINIDDVVDCERYSELIDHIGPSPTTSMMVSAMPDQSGKVIAVMQVSNRKHRPHFDNEEEEFLRNFCEQAGVVLKNALVFQSALSSREYHHTLVSASLRLCSEHSLPRLSREICDRAKDMLKVDQVTLYFREPEVGGHTDGWLRWQTGRSKFEKLKHLVGLAARVVMTGEVSVALDEPDETDSPGGFGKGEPKKRARNILSAPIFGQDRSVIGLVQVSRLQGAMPFGHENEEGLKSLCDIASIALGNACNNTVLQKELSDLRGSTEHAKGAARHDH